ncbi:MAG TPA: ESX secretion-associated protein EspG [Pseudonocardiaceae bacterium]|jgi:hypothetical protein
MRWQFSAAQWEVLTETLFPGNFGIQVYPAPIEVRTPGGTDVERSRSRAEASAELTRLGLLRAGQVEPDLAGALHVLHRPARWVHSVWGLPTPAGQLVRVVAGRADTVAVCAVQHPEQPGATLLEIIPAPDLVAAVIRRLPANPPGRSPAVTVPVESIAGRTAKPEPGGVLVTASSARSSADRAATTAQEILSRPHTRAGQIAVNVRNAAGQAHRSAVLSWRDYPDGRYQFTVSTTPGGPGMLTISPADPRRLDDGVQRLLAAVQPR